MSHITVEAQLEAIETASNYLVAQLGSLVTPTVGIICGSGLGGLSSLLENPVKFPYSSIPHFPKTTVAGHSGELVYGTLHSKPVLCMVGRFHFYEGYPLHQVTFPVRVMAKLGIQTLIVTNAAGGLNDEFKVGDVMVIEDHISIPNMSGTNPLVGPNLPGFGARFIPVSDCYDTTLREIAFKAREHVNTLNLGNPTLREGIYCNVSGPSYETRAESRLLKLAGGDAVGMSTVPEVLIARHCGLKVLGLSLITNKVLTKREPKTGEPKDETEIHASHEEVLEASIKAAKWVQALVQRIVELL